MSDCFESEFCRVEFREEDGVVLLTWKKFCCFEDYREPTLFASELLRRKKGSNFVIDARNGFEDEKEDVEWGFRVLLPDMARSECQKCIFIMEELPEIEEEITMWAAEFGKYFQVMNVRSYEEAVSQSRLLL